ncbi:MAG: NAD-dependent epimerase/dehydratase family protein [Bacteroidia bacterium]|nr:NAD-dependent epimerase/dehydratase family protein [Bacteroidia bacterium]
MNKLLIIGGSNFIGRNLVEYLLDSDEFEITLFNRGKTNPGLFPSVRHIIGDRNSNDVRRLRETDWDYVIDLSCYFPNSLQEILDVLPASVKRYVFISTCSVYDNTVDQSILRNESAPTLPCSHFERTDEGTATYGNRKAECERILAKSGVPHTILRPSLVYGKYDTTDRLYYWLHQVATKPELLLPNGGTSRFSVTYVHDLVRAIVKSIYEPTGNQTFNVTTIPEFSIRQLVSLVQSVLSTNPTLINGSPDFLHSQKIAQWTDMPLWLDCDYYTYANTKVVNDLGLHLTEPRTSIMETIAFYESLEWPTPTFGLDEAKRQSLLNKLKAA